MRHRYSIRTRLTLIVSAAVTATALLIGALAWLALHQTLVHQADRQLEVMARGRAGHLDPTAVAQIPDSPLAGPADIRIQVRLPNGQMVSGPPGTATLPFGGRDMAVVTHQTTEVHYTLSTDSGEFRILTVAGRNGQTLQLARSLSEADDTLRGVGILMVALVLGAAAVAGVAGRLIANAGLRPVNRFTHAAARVADTQDLRHSIPVNGRDEVAQLGHAFNRMLTALAQSRQAQRDLIEDAAHELRTPMSSMRINIELLVHAGDRLSGTDRDALLGDLERQSGELSELVGELVDLARSAGTGEPAVPTDLAEAAAGAIYRARARSPYARFELSAEPATVTAQPAALERALVNLLDNAAKFGPPDQIIEIRVGPSGTPDASADISVADRAPTIPESERERIFHRFHRLDTARAIPGSGLGLAIVHQTATQHGGTIGVEARRGGGNIFRLRLPLVPTPPAGRQ
ncbi:MAG TPA: HAMP domain-containing sensor histidine kinase [Rugosimonospora sp.]